MRVLLRQRPGLTWVEVLVVIGIVVVVLVGLLLSYRQVSYEDANRTTCRNNLRQLGYALHAYHDVNGRYPVEDYDLKNQRVQVNPRWHRFSLFVSLLPYIEQGTQLNGHSGDGGEWMLYYPPQPFAGPTGSD